MRENPRPGILRDSHEVDQDVDLFCPHLRRNFLVAHRHSLDEMVARVLDPPVNSNRDLSWFSNKPTISADTAWKRKSADRYAMRILSCAYASPRHSGLSDAGNFAAIHAPAHCSCSSGEDEMARNGNGLIIVFFRFTDATTFARSASKFLQSQTNNFALRRRLSVTASGLRDNALS